VIRLERMGEAAARAAWPTLVPALEYGLKRWDLPDGRRRYTPEGVEAMVFGGGLEMWRVTHETGTIGYVLLRVERGAEYDTMFQWFTWIYRKPSNWRRGLGTALVSLAGTLGCAAVEGVGRKGWAYIFREAGARELYEMTCFQAVTNGR
jgi:hypothetical protein